MQGGGFGFTSRKFGMNCDNVEAVLMMLADGSLVRADADTIPISSGPSAAEPAISSVWCSTSRTGCTTSMRCGASR